MQNLVIGTLLLVLAALVVGAFLFDQFGPKMTREPMPDFEADEVENTENRVVLSIGDDTKSPVVQRPRAEDGSLDWVKELVEKQTGVIPTEELRTMDSRGRIRHVVRRGETLASIARDLLGDKDLWTKIQDVNPTLTRPQDLREGQTILVPLRDAR